MYQNRGTQTDYRTFRGARIDSCSSWTEKSMKLKVQWVHIVHQWEGEHEVAPCWSYHWYSFFLALLFPQTDLQNDLLDLDLVSSLIVEVTCSYVLDIIHHRTHSTSENVPLVRMRQKRKEGLPFPLISKIEQKVLFEEYYTMSASSSVKISKAYIPLTNIKWTYHFFC